MTAPYVIGLTPNSRDRIGAVTPEEALPRCSVQSYVVNSSLDHAAIVGSNRSGT
jgi:hypothetical protein